MKKNVHWFERCGLRMFVLATLAVSYAVPAQAQTADIYLPFEGGAAYYKQWKLGPPHDRDYFPIGVWTQSPKNAALYKAVGVNLYVNLYNGTIEFNTDGSPQLVDLRKYHMPVFGDQESGLVGPDAAEHLTDPIIEGWEQSDEPDNAQTDANGNYIDCILPSAIVAKYQQYKAADPTRPVYLGVGQGAAYDADAPYDGRGATCTGPTRNLLDYPKYFKGADIVAQDTYPENNGHPMWWIGRVVDRMNQWVNYRKPAWEVIELANFNDVAGISVTPSNVRSEIYMTLIHGGMGISYFADQFVGGESPDGFEEDSLFFPEHADIKVAVEAIDQQLTGLARVLNTPSVRNGVTVTSSNPKSPIDSMLKRSDGSTFLFAMAGRGGGAATGTFTLRDCPEVMIALVLGENRLIYVRGGVFKDTFNAPYEVHNYQIFFDPNPHHPLLGDVNGDGVVNNVDAHIVKAALGTRAGQPGYEPNADVIRDGTVDNLDLEFIRLIILDRGVDSNDSRLFSELERKN